MDQIRSSGAAANAFEFLRLAGLSSTVDLRRTNERARVQRAMSSGGAAEATARVVEKLLQDPAFRLSEAAAWYYHFATPQEADAQDELTPHDETLALWHEIRADAEGGVFDAEEFEEALGSTVELFNNPATWQPLEEVIRDIADVRVDSRAMLGAAEEAASRWICDALFAVAGVNADDLGEAVPCQESETVRGVNRLATGGPSKSRQAVSGGRKPIASWGRTEL